MSNFLEHVNVILGKLRQDPITTLSVDTASEPYRVQLAVKRAIARVWNARQWTFKQRKTLMGIRVGTSEYILPKTVGEITLIISPQPPYFIDVIGEEEFDRRIPKPIATGKPTVGMLFEYTGVRLQPSTTAQIVIASNDATDTTQSVRIRGIVNEQEDFEDCILNGTAGITTTKSFSEVISVSKPTDTVGTISFIMNGTEYVAQLGPHEKTHEFKKIRLYPTPDFQDNISIKHFKVPFIPQAANDITEIPTRWDYVVEQWAFAMALQPKGQDQLAEQQAEFDLAEKYLNEDMASEERISSATVIQPDRAFDMGNRDINGLLGSSTDGFSFELY